MRLSLHLQEIRVLKPLFLLNEVRRAKRDATPHRVSAHHNAQLNYLSYKSFIKKEGGDSHPLHHKFSLMIKLVQSQQQVHRHHDEDLL